MPLLGGACDKRECGGAVQLAGPEDPTGERSEVSDAVEDEALLQHIERDKVGVSVRELTNSLERRPAKQTIVLVLHAEYSFGWSSHKRARPRVTRRGSGWNMGLTTKGVEDGRQDPRACSPPEPEDFEEFEKAYQVHVELAAKLPGMRAFTTTRTSDGLDFYLTGRRPTASRSSSGTARRRSRSASSRPSGTRCWRTALRWWSVSE